MVVSILQTTRDSTNKDDRVSGLLVKRSNRDYHSSSTLTAVAAFNSLIRITIFKKAPNS